MRVRCLAFGLTILSSAALAEPPADAAAQSAVLQAPRVPGATLAGPKRPDLDTQPLATDDRQAQGYDRRDRREPGGTGDDEDDNDSDGGGRGAQGGGMGRAPDMPAWHRRMMGAARMQGGMSGGMGARMARHLPALFIMRAGQNRLVVRCGPDESTRTCVDAMMPLLDRLQAMAPGGASTSAPQPPSTPR